MGTCVECRCSTNKRETCQDCGKAVCYKHRSDHSILLDWGDTTSEEYKCRECEDKYQARQKREAEVRETAQAKQKKMEELYQEHERQLRLAREAEERKVLEEAEAKFIAWEASNPNWLEDLHEAFVSEGEAYLRAWKNSRGHVWEDRKSQMRALKLKEFMRGQPE